MKNSDVTLWRAVLCRAALDAKLNENTNEYRDAEWHYTWAKSNNCKMICDFAHIDYDAVLDGFYKLYVNSKKEKR